MDYLRMVPTSVYITVGAIILAFIVLKLIGIRIIPSDNVGIAEKWWSFKGSIKDGGN